MNSANDQSKVGVFSAWENFTFQILTVNGPKEYEST